MVAGALVAILGLQTGFSSSFLSVFVAALRQTGIESLDLRPSVQTPS